MIFNISSLHPLGVTFLEWSVHYLAGKKTYFHLDSNKKVFLSKNPLKKFNAHNHCKNHPKITKRNDLNQLLQKQKRVPLDLCSSYPYFQKGISRNQIILLSKDIFKFHIQRNIKLIFIHRNTIFPFDAERFTDINELIKKYQLTNPNFKNCTNIQSFREVLSFRIEKMLKENNEVENIMKSFYHYKNILPISNLDLWSNGLKTIEKVFKFLEIKIDITRLSKWKKIYQLWSSKFQKKISFYTNIENISQSIIAGKNMPLHDYDINVFDEAFLMNHLMVNHRKKLKIMDLKQFPLNTEVLHRYL